MHSTYLLHSSSWLWRISATYYSTSILQLRVRVIAHSVCCVVGKVISGLSEPIVAPLMKGNPCKGLNVESGWPLFHQGQVALSGCHPLSVPFFVKCPVWGHTVILNTKGANVLHCLIRLKAETGIPDNMLQKNEFPRVSRLSLICDKISVQFHLTLLPLKLPKISFWPRTSLNPYCIFLFQILYSLFIQGRKKGLDEFNFASSSLLLCFFLTCLVLSSVLWAHIPVVSNLGWTHFIQRPWQEMEKVK